MRNKKSTKKTGYDSDVSDEEWAFCAPYLTLMKEDAPQREYSSRVIFNAMRYLVRAGCPWRLLPNDLPPWHTVFEQVQRWNKAGCFEALAHDLRILLRLFAGRRGQPTAVILDGRTVQSTPESGSRCGYDGYKRRKGSKVHIAVDTLGHLLALKVTAANEAGARAGRRLGQSDSRNHRRQSRSGFCRFPAIRERSLPPKLLHMP
jgi:transposase